MPPGSLIASTDRLGQLLHREEAACHALLETVQEERAAIRTLAITEFHAINCKRLGILESLQTLAQEREQLVQQIALLHRLGPTTSIHALIDCFTGPESSALRARYHSFTSIAKMVRAEIKHNVVLIEGIRGVVDQALSSGTKVIPGHDLYNNEGHSSTVAPVNAFIHQQG
jgi:hypothetical protein